MGEAQLQVQLRALRLGTVPDTLERQALFEALADTGDHVVQQGTEGSRHGHVLGVGPFHAALPILQRERNGGVQVHFQVALRTLDAHLGVADVDIDALGDLDRCICDT